jgi:ACS family tartrate transporter-like MFS transporter
MMFVRTPWQFYTLRFLLGVAEAGFFPGVVYYLSHWFPRRVRGRAISRFYFFGPLSSTIMGAASPPLLDLHGIAGLSGWQWLFLVEGLPAAFVGIAIFLLLPDSPKSVDWLNSEQKEWIDRQIAADMAKMLPQRSHSLAAALSHSAVLRFGLLGFLTIGATITYALSAPIMLRDAGFTTGEIGRLIMIGGILGALGMLATGWVSDHLHERFTTMWISTTLMGLSFAITATAHSPNMLAAAYLLYGLSWGSVTLSQVSAWPDVLHGRVLALGCAGINTLSQAGAFLLPVLWGKAADASGSFQIGLAGLIAATCAALLLTLEFGTHVKRKTAAA